MNPGSKTVEFIIWTSYYIVRYSYLIIALLFMIKMIAIASYSSYSASDCVMYPCLQST